MIQSVDLITEIPPPQAKDYVIYPWLSPGRLTLMIGPTEIGKTTLTLDMIASCLQGVHLWGRYPCRKIEHVLYLHAEHTLATIQEAASIHTGIDKGQVTIVHDFGEFGSALMRPDGTYNSTLLHELCILVDKLQPGLIIAEPISAFISSDENNNREVRGVINVLSTLGSRVNAAVLTHHHPGKIHFDPEHPRPAGIAYGEARGAMAFEDAAERVIYLKRNKGENSLRLETPKPKGYPVSWVTLSFNPDTLTYDYVSRPSHSRDIVALYDYRRHNPNQPIREMIAHFKETWNCGQQYVYQVLKRATKVGLFAHTLELEDTLS